MTVAVRQVDVESEREVLLGLLETNLLELPHRTRFRWLYLGNPAGRAWSWVAEAGKARRAIGMATVFPRAVWIDGRLARCGQVGDFAIELTYRSLGPAVMLQRATLEAVEAGTFDFCYDCPPDDRGMAPFRRLGIPLTCQTRRYVRLIRCDRQLQKRLGRHLLTSALACMGNAILGLPRRRATVNGIEIARHAGRFGEDFSALDGRLAGQGAIRCRRAAADLNWRYRDDPVHAYEVLVARRRGELVAFAILATAGEDTWLVDLFGEQSDHVMLALLDAAADHARRASKQTLQTVVADTPELRELLQPAGFRFRATGPSIMAYARPRTDAHALLRPPAPWPLRQADILA